MRSYSNRPTGPLAVASGVIILGSPRVAAAFRRFLFFLFVVVFLIRAIVALRGRLFSALIDAAWETGGAALDCCSSFAVSRFLVCFCVRVGAILMFVSSSFSFFFLSVLPREAFLLFAFLLCFVSFSSPSVFVAVIVRLGG